MWKVDESINIFQHQISKKRLQNFRHTLLVLHLFFFDIKSGWSSENFCRILYIIHRLEISTNVGKFHIIKS